jgi:hypothetical protein
MATRCVYWPTHPRTCSGPATRLLAFASHGAATERAVGLIAGKEPACRSAQAPPVPQHVEQGGREHHVAIFEALPLLDADHHPAAVDIGGSQVERFRDAQAGGQPVDQMYRAFRGRDADIEPLLVERALKAAPTDKR